MPSKPDPLLQILANPDRRVSACKLCVWLQTASTDRAKAVKAAMADPLMGIQTIKRALVAGGVTHIGNHVLTRHRQEEHDG